MRISTVALIGSMSIFAACGVQEESREVGTTTMNTHVVPIPVPGNPSCADLNSEYRELKVENPPQGHSSYSEDGLDVELWRDDEEIDWHASAPIECAIVKGGPNANVYCYDPNEMWDEDVQPPTNPNTGQPYGVSHISFCYIRRLGVSKTVETRFEREYTWEIDKTVVDPEDGELSLAEGQTYTLRYLLSLWRTPVDTFTVWGTITVDNSWPDNAEILSVDDMIDGIEAAVDCGVTFPHILGPGQSLDCTYHAMVPDGMERENTVTVATTGLNDIFGNSATEPVVFPDDPNVVTDECVIVTDEDAGLSVMTCEDHPTIPYSVDIRFDECGMYEYVNTACFETNDTGATGCDSETVDIDVICPGDGGCTLTQGYWKTHSEFGPAPFDDTWSLLPMGASTPFFLSGQTWYGVFNTPPDGNAYYILAVQYMAAVLNGLNGADTSAITAELMAAEQLFNTYTPEQIAMLPGDSMLRQEFIDLAAMLADFNEGIIGPGHCSE